MIDLDLSIYDGDSAKIEFKCVKELLEYLNLLNKFDAVWLVSGEESKQLIITESVETISNFIQYVLPDAKQGSFNVFVQEYPSYYEAYQVALSIMEQNPKCY